jgi:hypothetical protein
MWIKLNAFALQSPLYLCICRNDPKTYQEFCPKIKNANKRVHRRRIILVPTLRVGTHVRPLRRPNFTEKHQAAPVCGSFFAASSGAAAA